MATYIKKKRLPFPVTVVLILLSTLLFFTAAFYYGSFRQLNRLITAANRGIESSTLAEEDVISAEDLEKLTFVQKPSVSTFYVDGICIPILKKLGIGETTFSCTADYTVYDPYSHAVLQKVEQRKFTVTMKFLNFRWTVDTVLIE